MAGSSNDEQRAQVACQLAEDGKNYNDFKEAKRMLKDRGYYFDGEICWHESEPEITKIHYREAMEKEFETLFEVTVSPKTEADLFHPWSEVFATVSAASEYKFSTLRSALRNSVNCDIRITPILSPRLLDLGSLMRS